MSLMMRFIYWPFETKEKVHTFMNSVNLVFCRNLWAIFGLALLFWTLCRVEDIIKSVFLGTYTALQNLVC